MPLIGWKTRSLAADTIELIQGRRYRGTVELAWYQAIASNERVAEEFTKLGFTDVTVTGNGSLRQGEATWSKPTQTIERPPQIKKVELIEA